MIRTTILLILATPLILVLLVALVFMFCIGWLAEPLMDDKEKWEMGL